jgi:cation:H+ antiporter
LDQARRAENKLGLAEHLADASARLGVSTFALALLLAGAEPEELATAVTATLRGGPSIAYGNVIDTNVAIRLRGA